jgi:hypothetical protein
LLEHDLRANAVAFVATENRYTLFRIMLVSGSCSKTKNPSMEMPGLANHPRTSGGRSIHATIVTNSEEMMT